MSRRLVIVGAVLLALFAAVRLLNYSVHPALASHKNLQRAATPVPSEQPAPAASSATATAPEPTSSAAPATSNSEAERSAEPFPSSNTAKPASQDPLAGITDIDPHKAFGSKSAPIVMEVFSDYQCPACKSFFLTTNRPLIDNYVSTGKVYLIHRDFPLPIHAYSRIAARYARAAAQIGKGEAVDQALFQNQEKWEQTGDVDGTVAAALSSAEMTKVRNLVKGGALDAAIDKDYALGQTYHVNQTPTTVFHSKGQTLPYAGVMSYDILHQFLDQLLSQR